MFIKCAFAHGRYTIHVLIGLMLNFPLYKADEDKLLLLLKRLSHSNLYRKENWYLTLEKARESLE